MIEKRDPQNLLLRQQCDEIQNYIEQFPIEEREPRIMEWIEKYAIIYRKNMEAILAFTERTLKEGK